MRSASVIFMSRTEAITCLLQTVTLRGCEERIGYKGSTIYIYIYNASTVAAAVGEKAHLETKQR